MALEVV